VASALGVREEPGRTLTATLSAVQATATTISLATSNSAVAGVIPSVTLPAGVASTTFTVTGGALGNTAIVTASLPPAIGGASDPTPITVNNRQPQLVSTSPPTRTAGTPGYVLTLNGSDFVAGATLSWTGQADLPTFGSGAQLTAWSRLVRVPGGAASQAHRSTR